MIHSDSLTRRRPQHPTRYDDLIIKTLMRATNAGKAENTVRSIAYSLKRLSKHADLRNPEEAKA